MIPIKLISIDEARRLGLEEKPGEAIVAVGIVVTGKEGQEPIMVERTILRMNGKKELEFMSDDRKKMIDNQGELANYLDQFEKIEGIEKKEYFEKNSLKQKSL